MNKKFISGLSKTIKYIILSLIILMIFLGAWLSLSIMSVVEDTQDIDAQNMTDLIAQTSEILDSEGNLIEKVSTTEYREVVELDKIPKYLGDAFIAVEDERFYEHRGVDPHGIAAAMFENIKAGGIVRGASTIAQQLARNIYLTDEQSYTRKIQEAYIALQITEKMGRDKVLEAYMNTVFFGQNAYGVQAASEIYFSKDVSELTIAESAALAGIVKSPTSLALYKTILPSDVQDEDKIIGDVLIDNVVYKAVWNDAAIERQKYVLQKMLETEKITQNEYDEAVKEDIVAHLHPGVRHEQNLSSYYSQLVQKQVVEKLMTELDLSYEVAKSKLVTGGLKIYTVVDQELQKELEELYSNFADYVLRGYGQRTPAMLNWSSDGNSNITNSIDQVIYFAKSNLITEESQLVYIPSSLFEVKEDGSILFYQANSQRIRMYGNNLKITDFYTVNDDNQLLTHKITGIPLRDEDFQIDDENNIILNESFLAENGDFYSIDENGNMIISDKYYNFDEYGIKQPQSSSVVVENGTGYIRAVIGGLEKEESGVINRATNVPRQPGSTMKPISVYTPALDNGYSPASGIYDVPFYDDQGNLWPRNWYGGYKGLVSLRTSVEQSINVNAVKVLDDIGIRKSKEYLEKFGLIDPLNANNDNFVTSQENSQINDENLAAMALGAMTHGLTNLEMTGAFNALANEGMYLEPITFTKILDVNGDVLIEDVQKKEQVVSKEVAYIMTDVLRTSTNHTYSVNARKNGFDIAGKTGTTQENTDLWFVGYSPYFTIGTWIGFDNQQLKLSQNSGDAVKLWSRVNNIVLDGYEQKRFDRPDDIVEVQVCTLSNSLPKKSCFYDHRGVTKYELYVKGQEPTEYCEVHVSRQINVVDGLLATNRTPSQEIGYKTFIQRPVPYNPSENNYIYPDDYYLSLPGYSPRTQSDYRAPEPEKDEDDDDDNEDNDDDNEDNDRGNSNSNSSNNSSNNSNNNDRGSRRNRDRD